MYGVKMMSLVLWH